MKTRLHIARATEHQLQGIKEEGQWLKRGKVFIGGAGEC